jgi:hypothetical protein
MCASLIDPERVVFIPLRFISFFLFLERGTVMVSRFGGGRRPGLSRVELSLVIVMGAIVTGVCVPGCQKARITESSRYCINNLKQIGLGVHNFESTFKRLPPLYGGNKDGASRKFPNTWGSTHVFLLPYIEMDNLYRKMAMGQPIHYVPANADANHSAVSTYTCWADPTLSDGIVNGSHLGGSSYVANAQVFAPLQDETINGAGNMVAAPKPNYCDRGKLLADIKDGASNTIGFMHTYALCGPDGKGSAWGYTAGLNEPPGTVQTFQPWARATYIGQSGMLAKGDRAFQVQPNPYNQKYDPAKGSGCNPLEPATPHGVMIVVMMGGSTRFFEPSVSADLWNKACLPNDGVTPPSEEW